MTLNFRAKNLKKQVCNFLPKNCNYFLWRENSKTILQFFQKKKKKSNYFVQHFCTKFRHFLPISMRYEDHHFVHF